MDAIFREQVKQIQSEYVNIFNVFLFSLSWQDLNQILDFYRLYRKPYSMKKRKNLCFSSYLSRLSEEQYSLALFEPETQERLHHHQLARAFPIAKVLLLCQLVFWDSLQHLRPTGEKVRMVADFTQCNQTRENLKRRETDHFKAMCSAVLLNKLAHLLQSTEMNYIIYLQKIKAVFYDEGPVVTALVMVVNGLRVTTEYIYRSACMCVQTIWTPMAPC